MTPTMTETCSHEDTTIIKACCPPFGLVECGCGGRDEVVCNNVNCTGISDDELELIFEGQTIDCD